MSDRLANDAWEALMTAHARLLRQFAADDWEELSMREYDVLYTLAKHGPVRIGELGESVLLSQPGLSRLVDRLAQRGLVERSADPADGRSVRVGLTPSGATCQKTVGRRHARSVAQALAVLTPSEQKQLRTLTEKLNSTTSSRAPAEHSRGTMAEPDPTMAEPDEASPHTHSPSSSSVPRSADAAPVETSAPSPADAADRLAVWDRSRTSTKAHRS